MTLPNDLRDHVFWTITDTTNYATLCLISKDVRRVVIEKAPFETDDLLEWYTITNATVLPLGSQHTPYTNKYGAFHFDSHTRCLYIDTYEYNIAFNQSGYIISGNYNSDITNCVWTSMMTSYLQQIFPRLFAFMPCHKKLSCHCDKCREYRHPNWFPDPTPRIISVEPADIKMIKKSETYKIKFYLEFDFINKGYVSYESGIWSNIFVPIDGGRYNLHKSNGNYQYLLNQMTGK